MNGASGSSESGFSLVEIVMAVFILSLATAVIVLNMPPAQTDADRYVERLEQQIARASEQAILAGQPLGLAVAEDHYAFLRYREGGWVEIEGSKQILPPGVVVKTRHADQEFEENSGLEIEKTLVPEVVFDRTGAVTPVTIEVASPDINFNIHLLANGTHRIEGRRD